ncbi:MAG: hypothetical protein QNJ41_00530 [Xenococcaceae cyanobacterium MO_188.B32]|nr:hypothetical protein [Xenococcaceae cyanobacterium MO_188.B32]
MFKPIQNRHLMVVDLTDKVSAATNIARENHAALRSGFVGFPPNPRWNTTKFCAWRTGCQWRDALAQGTMIVRGTDSMLVPALETEVYPEEEEPPSSNYGKNYYSVRVLQVA